MWVASAVATHGLTPTPPAPPPQTYAPLGGKPYPVPEQIKEAAHVVAPANALSPAHMNPADEGLEDHALAPAGPPVGIIVLALVAVAGVAAVVVSKGKSAKPAAPAAAAKAAPKAAPKKK